MFYTYILQKELAEVWKHNWCGGQKIILALAGNYNNGSFNNRDSNGNWWSSTENDASNAWNRNLNSGDSTVNRNNNDKTNGFSVRCLKHWL